MIFQIMLMNEIQNMFYYLQTAGIIDIILPFILIFTVLFAILKQVPLLADKRHHITVALAITLLVIIPHITQSIPAEYDVVQIINNSLPAIVLIIFIVLMAMILLGFITGKQVALESMATGIVAIVTLILVGIIFARSAGYFQQGWPTWLYWLDDPYLGALIVVIGMFALIVWFITYDGSQGDWKKKTKKFLTDVGNEIFGGQGKPQV